MSSERASKISLGLYTRKKKFTQVSTLKIDFFVKIVFWIFDVINDVTHDNPLSH